MIKLNIDVNKISKERLYKGQKGTYLNAVLIPTPNSEYGDFMIVEEVTKEEREAGKKGIILGNAKHLNKQTNETHEQQTEDEGDDLPF